MTITPDRKLDLTRKDITDLDPLLHELTSMQMHESPSAAIAKYELPQKSTTI